jgi:hypothetical protein
MLGRFAGFWVLLEMTWCVKDHIFHVLEVICLQTNYYIQYVLLLMHM